jgi:hypothetical protein
MMNLEHEPLVKDAIDDCVNQMELFENLTLYPAQLIEIETKLSVRYTYLMGMKARYQLTQNSHYWVRKIEQGRQAIKARKSVSVNSDAMAVHKGNLNIQEYIDQENYSVWRYEHLKGFCQGLDKILIAIAHRLKDAESEKRVSQKGDKSW